MRHIPATAAVAISMIMGLAASAGSARADLPSGNFGGGTRITVGVDNDYCRTGGVQCSAFGAPANGNRIPIGIRFEALTGGGIPVTTIVDANVAISTDFVPAGGANAVKRSCVSCFQSTPDGVYGFFIEPAVGTAWKSGTYYVQVQVTKGTFVARARPYRDQDFNSDFYEPPVASCDSRGEVMYLSAGISTQP